MSARTYGLLPAVLVVAACGVSEGKFIPDYADVYCARRIECSDPATLVFDGIDGPADCVASFGPELSADGEGCKYKGGTARKCLDAMETVACPAEGEGFDTVVPPICEEVYIKCIATSTPADDGTNADTGP
jgi:hypothetical protein